MNLTLDIRFAVAGWLVAVCLMIVKHMAVDAYDRRYGPGHRPWSEGLWLLGWVVGSVFSALIGKNVLMLMGVAALSSSLVGLCFVDLRYQMIPDRLQAGVLVGVVFLLAGRWSSLIDLLMTVVPGIALSVGLALLTLFYEKVRKKEGLGWGDVKLISSLSLLFGAATLTLVLLACLFAATYLGVRSRREGCSAPFAFGPFLALASLLSMFFF